MDFKEATDGLFARVDHEELAEELGVSVATIRQARLRRDAAAYRVAPADWRRAVIRLAERRVRHYEQLVHLLRDDAKVSSTMAAHFTNGIQKVLTNQ
jgi:hypothetical protein